MNAGEQPWYGILDVFSQQAGRLPEHWEDTFWIGSLVDLAKLLDATRNVLSAEQQGVLVALGACVVRQIEKEGEARDLAAVMINAARRGEA